VRELTIESPPYFRKSFGISSTPGALPDFNDLRVTEMDSLLNTTNKEKRIEDNDDISKCLSSHFSRIGKDSTVNTDFRKYILNYVEEKQVSIGNDETYLPVVFNNEGLRCP
jgi:hypothetical protein